MLAPAVMFDASETVAAIRGKLEGIREQEPVVIRRQAGLVVFWYAVPAGELLYWVANSPDQARLGDLGVLHEHGATPTVAADDPEPDFVAVRLSGDNLVGVDLPVSQDADDLPVSEEVDDHLPFDDFEISPLRAPRRVSREALHGAPPPPDAPFTAYPVLRAPPRVAGGGSFSLRVLLSSQADAATTGGPIQPRIAAGIEDFELEVQVLTPPGFEAPDGRTAKLRVNRRRVEDGRVEIRLVAPPVDGEPLLATLTVTFSYAGQLCGIAGRRLAVIKPGSDYNEDAADHGLAWTDDKVAAGTCRVDDSLVAPDLTVCITKSDGNPASGNYEWSFMSPHQVSLPEPQPMMLGQDAATFAKSVLNGVHEFAATPALDHELTQRGALVAGKVPDVFWPLLREVAAKAGRPPTVLVATAEQFMPWELALMDDPLDDTQPAFLGAQVAMGRWILEAGGPELPPPAMLGVVEFAVVVGKYGVASGQADLPEAVKEGEELESKFHATLLEANWKDILDLLKGKLPRGDLSGPAIVHFACHGEADPTRADASGVVLNDGSRLPPHHIYRTRLGTEFSPLLFLNACEVGTADALFDNFAGFAGMSIRGGFRAFVAPLWKVNDHVAHKLSVDFYQAGQSGVSAGEALRQLRCRYDGQGSEGATWLAYVFYGHPGLAISL